MKNIIKIVALSLVLVMSVLALASCGDKAGAVKSAFEGEGYKVNTTKYEDLDKISQGVIETILGEKAAENMAGYEVITCSKGLSSAFIVKFPAEGDIKNALTIDGDTELFDELKAEGAINGNCLILTLSPDALEIFKNA